MDSRITLSSRLHAVLGTDNVYFEPPESTKMNYPAIRYALSKIDVDRADNKNYTLKKCYTVTLIHKDPDNTIKEAIMEAFDHISFDRTYVANNLHHYVYTLYF